MKEYDQLAEWYPSHRSAQIGIKDISTFAASLPLGSNVLDLGCGDGIPISRFLLEGGFNLYGIDSSPKMIKMFKKNLPGVPVDCSDLLQSSFFDMKFDAVVAYGLMFHFPQDKQESVIVRVSEHLVERGKFLFNSSKEQGETVSEMNGVKVPHWSMSAPQYIQALHKNDLMAISDYEDKQSGTHIYLAQKRTRNLGKNFT